MERPNFEDKKYDTGDVFNDMIKFKKDVNKYIDDLESKNDSVLSSIKAERGPHGLYTELRIVRLPPHATK